LAFHDPQKLEEVLKDPQAAEALSDMEEGWWSFDGASS
jgi:hypothetical protein